ncbi:IclR family transcriptional regulator [Alpinimonas psychrophila]|uniref:DNA-binding IclR family transcriptional regulator n=1 Tax=Alpinimonas psychrophila TaxID=748908 RepID=A0A7W3JTX3_9MICO|nr:IclR family transcriptional regulator [Alpinimonas psychrophila]MBA8829027.1 DNA-binding IclR family transcriptional regulator [Alpinimonas psychrophila]
MSQTVVRALDILRFISTSPRSLTEVAAHLDVHKSTALRLLQTLSLQGFARQLSNGAYVTGFGIIALGQLAIDQIDARTIAHPHVQRLSEESGHTVHLAQLTGDEVVYVDKVDGATMMMGSRIGLRAETHSASVAKVVLAFADEAVREKAITAATFQRYSSTTIVTAEALRQELSQVRSRGWAEDNGEKEDYINCVALPIYDARGKVSMGVSLTALKVVAPLEVLRARIPEFRLSALTISREFGWRGDEYGKH